MNKINGEMVKTRKTKFVEQKNVPSIKCTPGEAGLV
jgi:hypothetical protein